MNSTRAFFSRACPLLILSRLQGPVVFQYGRHVGKRENPGDDVLTCIMVSIMADEEAQTAMVGFAIFALISREMFFARDVNSGLLRFYNWRPFRNFKGMVLFSRSIHQIGT